MLVLIVGLTNTGKTRLAKKLQEKLGFKDIVSNTTRPMRVGEVNGVDHYFVSEEEMQVIKKDAIAYVKNRANGYEYCASKNSITGENQVYVIDPDGIEDLVSRGLDIEYRVVYLYASDEELIRRLILRKDNLEDAKARIVEEHKYFDKFCESGKPDLIVDTTSLSDEEVYNKVMAYLQLQVK